MKQNHTLLLFALILMVGCFGSIASDIYAPSIPYIATELNPSIDHVQWSMAIFMLGISISQLFYGPISEAFGGKPPILFGLMVASIGSLVCIFSSSIEMLIVGRFIQGLGTGALSSLCRTIFRDSYSGKELARMGFYLVVTVSFFIPAAPLFGGYLQHHLTWQASFIFLFIYSTLAFIMAYFIYNESHSNKDRGHLNIKKATASYLSRLTNRYVMGYSLCGFFCFGAFFHGLVQDQS